LLITIFFYKWKLIFNLLKNTCFFCFLIIIKHLLLCDWLFRDCIIYRNNEKVFRFLVLIHSYLVFIYWNIRVILVKIEDIKKFLCNYATLIVFILKTLLYYWILRIWGDTMLINLKLLKILLQLFFINFWNFYTSQRLKFDKVKENMIELSLSAHNIQNLKHIIFKLLLS
jgi:hypothetical protein